MTGRHDWKRPTLLGLRLAPLVALGAALALAGCGGSSPRAPAGPRLPRAVAQRLAERADRLAALYEHGSCASVNGARALLQRAAIAEVNAHRVPAAFQEELLAAVNGLPARSCPRPAPAAPAPPAPPAPAARGKAKGHAKGHAKHDKEKRGKGKGHEKHGEGKGDGD